MTDALTYWWKRAKKYEDALAEIKKDEGHVCTNYELCTHAACASSYGAWAISDKALREP